MARLHALQGFGNPFSKKSITEWAKLHGYLEHGSRVFEAAQGASGIASHFLKSKELEQFSGTIGNITSGITAVRIVTSIPGDIFSQTNFVATEIIDSGSGKTEPSYKGPFIFRASGQFKTHGVENVNWMSTIGNFLIDVGRPIATVSWLDRLGVIELGKNAKARIGGAVTGIFSVALTLFAIDGIRGLWNEYDARSTDMVALLHKEKGSTLLNHEQKRLDAHISALYHKGFWFGNGIIDLLNSIAGGVSSMPLLGAVMHLVAGSFWMLGCFWILPNNDAHKV